MDCVDSGKRLPGAILSGFDTIKKVYLEQNVTCYHIIQGRLHCGHRLMLNFGLSKGVAFHAPTET